MEIRTDQLVQVLRDQGHEDQALRAEKEFGHTVETDDLTGYDFDPRELLFKLGGEYDTK